MAAGEDVGPLCGLAIVAKDLFDVAGYTTAAGTPALMGARGSTLGRNALSCQGAKLLPEVPMQPAGPLLNILLLWGLGCLLTAAVSHLLTGQQQGMLGQRLRRDIGPARKLQRQWLTCPLLTWPPPRPLPWPPGVYYLSCPEGSACAPL